MKKIAVFLPLVLAFLPFSANAHERQVFEINGIKYQFVIGSASEPIYVDDKSGVEVRIERVSILDGHEEHHHDVGPGAVEGLEETLKVELIAGDSRKTLDFTTVYDEPGLYRAAFYPTAAEQLSYRIFGTLEDVPVDLTFTCNPVGHQMESAVDERRTEISSGVVRVMKTGSFGCPREKKDMGFPYDTADIVGQRSDVEKTGMAAWGALATSVAALGVALFRRRT
jgi:hypothetical protein